MCAITFNLRGELDQAQMAVSLPYRGKKLSSSGLSAGGGEKFGVQDVEANRPLTLVSRLASN